MTNTSCGGGMDDEHTVWRCMDDEHTVWWGLDGEHTVWWYGVGEQGMLWGMRRDCAELH